MRTFFKISSPCSVAWKDLKGDSKKRHCDLCGKDVHNVCRMDRSEMKELLRTYKGEKSFCIYLEPTLLQRLGLFFGAVLLSIFVVFKSEAGKKYLFGKPNQLLGATVLDESKFTEAGADD